MTRFLRIQSVFQALICLAVLVMLSGCDTHSSDSSEDPVRRYSDQEISYFVEIALGSEYGGGSAVVRKWREDLRVKVMGTLTSADQQTIETVVAELNDLIDEITISLVEDEPNVEMHFAPESEFASINPHYVPVNLGFFSVFWNANTINRAIILIATDYVTQQERSHLIREEFTQSLGLMKDSYRYEDSIFYQGWTDVVAYSAIDRALIQMLYSPEIYRGMSEEQVVSVLEAVVIE